MATVLQIIEKAYTKVNGEFSSLSETEDDFKTYLNILNQVMESWAETPYVKWQSLFDMDYTIGNVSANTLIYPIDDANVNFGNTPFDHVFFVNSAGDVVDRYKVTDQAMFEATNDQKVCAIVSDGLHLKSTTDVIVGATIRLPAYVKPPVYKTANQKVVIDSVSWLVSSMAAFVCASSPVPFISRNADRFEKQATVFMKTMRDNNRHRQHLVIKRVNGATSRTWADVMAGMRIADIYHG